MKSILYLLILGSLLCYGTSCNNATASDLQAMHVTPEGLNWYSIDDLDKMNNLKDKKVLVDLYTDWCGWCKVMDKKTFTDPEIVQYLNDNFVLIKFNAEQRESVVFQGETYEWMKLGRKGVNKFAMKLADGRMSYPTLVYLDSNLNKIKASPGYKRPNQLMAELQAL